MKADRIPDQFVLREIFIAHRPAVRQIPVEDKAAPVSFGDDVAVDGNAVLTREKDESVTGLDRQPSRTRQAVLGGM